MTSVLCRLLDLQDCLVLYNDNNAGAKSERVYCLIGSQKRNCGLKLLQHPSQVWRLLQDFLSFSHTFWGTKEWPNRDDFLLDLIICLKVLLFCYSGGKNSTQLIPNERKCWRNDPLGAFQKSFSHEGRWADKKRNPSEMSLNTERNTLKWFYLKSKL